MPNSYSNLLLNIKKTLPAMKNKILVLCLLLLLGCKSKPVYVAPVVIKYVKVSPSEVDVNQKKKAYELGKRVLMICNTSKFIPFTQSEAT